MATTRKAELNALLNPLQKAVSGATTSIRALPSVPLPSLPTFSSGDSNGWGATFFSFALALLVVFLILLVVHYAITPIFSFTAGDGGSIPLASTTDGQLVWSKGPPLADVSANVVRILPHGFTIQQDVYIENETTLGNRKRLFFYRSLNPVLVDPAESEDLLVQYPESNLFMYLSPTTNDLIVSAVSVNPTTRDELFESSPTLLNIPTKQVIRLTVILMPQVLEVYLNGKLHGTKTFRYPVKSSDANFYSTPDAFRGTVRAMNFKYWDRPLSAVEVSKSGPPLADKTLFSPEQMTTAQCS